MADDDGMPGEQLEEPGFPAGDQADHGVEGVFDIGVGESVDAAGPTAAGPTADESERHESVGDADVRAPGRTAAEGAGGGLTPAGAVDSDWPARHGEGSQAADQVALVGDSQDVTAAAETSVGRGLEPGDSDMTASGSGVVAETMTGEIESVDGNRPAAPETGAAEARFDEGHHGEVDTDGPPSPSAGSSPDVVAAAAVSRPEPALAAGVPAGSSAGVGEESAGVGEESAGVGEESRRESAGVAGQLVPLPTARDGPLPASRRNPMGLRAARNPPRQPGARPDLSNWRGRGRSLRTSSNGFWISPTSTATSTWM